MKEKESGLWELAQHLRVPFVVFSAGELKKVPGDFTVSAFVAQTVGVDNVCERAAVAAADGGSLLIHKQAMDGVTIAWQNGRKSYCSLCETKGRRKK